MILKKKSKDEKAEWVVVDQSIKRVASSDIYVLGHQDVKMPAIVAKSSLKGVKARLVSIKDSTPKAPTTLTDKDKVVLKTWSFTKDDETRPVYFKSPEHIEKDFWVEMLNPNEEDAIVNALVHGLIRSKRV